MVNIKNCVERHSLFQPAGLLDFYDIEREEIIPSGFNATSFLASNMPNSESSFKSKHFKEPKDLFDALDVGLDQRTRLLSESLCPELTRFLLVRFVLAVAGLRKHTCKLVVIHERFSNQVSFGGLRSRSQAALSPLNKAPSSVSHVIVGMTYSMLELVVFEHEPSEEPEEIIRTRLEQAVRQLVAFTWIGGWPSELHKSLRLSYFDTVSCKPLSDVSAADFRSLVKHFRELGPIDPATLPDRLKYSVKFHLMPLSDFMDAFGSQYPSRSIESLAKRAILEQALKKRLAELLLEVQVGLWEVNQAELRLHDKQYYDENKLLRQNMIACLNALKIAWAEFRLSGMDARLVNVLGSCEALLGKIEHVSALNKLLDAWTKVPMFEKVGVQLLIAPGQLKGPAKKRILVFEPAIREQNSGEWKWHMGCFMEMINNRHDELFFICTLEYFNAKVSQAPLKSAKAFILDYTAGKFELILTSMMDAAAVDEDYVMVGKEDCAENAQPAPTRQANEKVESVTKADVELKRRKEIGTEPIPLCANRLKKQTQASKEPESPVQIGETINILLLGETGVGKSTFINAYYNYLTFGSLEEAMKEPKLHGLVCSTFSFTDSQLNVKKVTVSKNIASDSTVNLMNDGIDCEANESAKPGQSSTQHAKAYEFKHKGRLIRLIDTPGIGDSRGISTDQANFKQTIEYLSRLNHLNAVCIMLKAEVLVENQTRYCINEIFSHLNKASICNVVFCFTHSSGTRLTLGDTLNSLRKFIAKEIEAVSNVKVPVGPNNIFCMDNEAFRYLVLAKNVKSVEERACFNELGHQKTFAESWQISKEASEKLIKYTEALPVLKMSEMVAYNQSRSMSLKLVDKVIAVLVRLAQSRADLGIGVDKKSHSRGILDLTAAITRFFSAHSLTTFNDQFDVRFEKTIRTCKTSLNERESRIIPSLEAFRADYKAALHADNDGELTADLNVDAKILKLIFLILEIRSHETNHKR